MKIKKCDGPGCKKGFKVKSEFSLRKYCSDRCKFNKWIFRTYENIAKVKSFVDDNKVKE